MSPKSTSETAPASTTDSRNDRHTDRRPIGLFDSGIGGLTVLRSLMQHLPNESFVYLGDTARLPYGSKSPATIERYLNQNIDFLCALDVKAVVVACNSASTVLLGKAPSHTIPVYNVIEPGARAALEASPGKRIGVLGTKATIGAGAYAHAIHVLDSSAEVFSQACPLLVPLVEEGWEDDPLTNLIVYRYVGPLLHHKIDTLILGCTHYPVLSNGISKVTGQGVTLVDSAEAIANLIQSDFASGRVGAADPKTEKLLKILITDVSPSFTEVATRLMQPHVIPPLQLVDIGTLPSKT